jgi:hypothetical protein
MTIALAIPTSAAWVPERKASLDRLRDALGVHWTGLDSPLPCASYREFTEKAPNSVWCEQLWTWLYETGAGWCLQLQDDVMVAPCFWEALRAMTWALPDDAEVLGLTSVHPMTPDVAKRGHRWYRTPANLVGWAYALRRDTLGEFLAARKQLPDAFRAMNEDEQIAMWCERSGRAIWHPVPAICDHDTSIPSSYANDAHSHRRPQVTWRTFSEAELTDPSWWKPSGTPEMLAVPPQFECWGCGKEPGKLRFETGVRLGPNCVAAVMGHLVSRI